MALVLFGVVGQGRIRAQDATPSRTPSPFPTAAPIHPTWGPIITNTPAILTATPEPTKDRSGCPDEPVSPSGVDPLWSAYCARCLADKPTPVATVKQFTLATVPPIGTAVTQTALPTLPPLYVEPVTPIPPTSTTAATAAPTSTPTVGDYDLYWDFRESPHGAFMLGETFLLPPSISGYCGVGSAFFDVGAGWGYGIGFQGQTGTVFVPDRCGGTGIRLDLPNLSALNFSSVYDVEFYVTDNTPSGSDGIEVVASSGSWGAPTDNQVCSYWGTGAKCNNPSTDRRWAWGSAYVGVSMDDLRGLVLRAVDWQGGQVIVQGLEVHYHGVPFDEGTAVPTSTAAATSTAAPTLAPAYNCAVPLTYDTSEPIAGVSFDDTDLGENCYTVIPPINVTATDPDIVFDGLEICVQWRALPTVSLLGITFQIDLLLIIPAAFVVRKLLLM